MNVYVVDTLMNEARRIAAEYRKATGKPLSISSEIAEYDAARLLDLELNKPQEGGYDAIGRGARAGKRIQIKGRAIFDEGKAGARIGQLKLEKDWDSVILVLMDERYEPIELYEVQRQAIMEAIAVAKSSNRNKRGAMSVAKFKAIGMRVWAREEGEKGAQICDNQTSPND